MVIALWHCEVITVWDGQIVAGKIFGDSLTKPLQGSTGHTMWFQSM